jgi:hypothetical protein
VIQIPLLLWNRPHWELNGRWDSVQFFRRLPTVLPDATTLFTEGTSVAPDVEDFLRSSAQPGDYLPMPQTLWPRARQYQLRCDTPTLMALADLAERHAEPELLDHLFVYSGSRVLLEFPDAFARGCPAYFSSDIDEQSIRSFAEAMGLHLKNVQPGG